MVDFRSQLSPIVPNCPQLSIPLFCCVTSTADGFPKKTNHQLRDSVFPIKKNRDFMGFASFCCRITMDFHGRHRDRGATAGTMKDKATLEVGSVTSLGSGETAMGCLESSRLQEPIFEETHWGKTYYKYKYKYINIQKYIKKIKINIDTYIYIYIDSDCVIIDLHHYPY